jgi:hypothetical protein
MSAPVTPTPEVVFNIKSDVVREPPTNRGDTRLVPNVPVVPILSALAAEIPPDVRIAPVIELVVSKVDGANKEADAPVPPIVSNVVAPAHAVKEVDPVVTEVVKLGDVPKTPRPVPVSSESNAPN